MGPSEKVCVMSRDRQDDSVVRHDGGSLHGPTCFSPPCSKRSAARGNGCLTSNTPMARGAPNCRATPSWRARPFCCWPFSAARIRDVCRTGGHISGRAATARRRLGHVSRRQDGNQRQREGLLRLETHRPRSRRRIHATCPDGHSRPRRGRCRQQLHAILPGAVGADFLRTMSGRAAGNRAFAAMVSRESVCGQRLVANDDCAAVDHFRHAAGAAAGTAPGHPRVVCAGAEGLAGVAMPGTLRRLRAAQLEPLLPHDRWAAEVVSEASPAAVATQSDRRRRTLDDRTIRRQRRARRHLSAHGVEPGGPEMSGLSGRQPRGQYCHERLQGLVLEDEATGVVRVQPCKSPVWDTAITVRALAASGIRSDNPAMRQAVAWLLARQVRRFGDWAETVRAEPGGWCFEYANDFYPDSDDTAMVLMACTFSRGFEGHEALPVELRWRVRRLMGLPGRARRSHDRGRPFRDGRQLPIARATPSSRLPMMQRLWLR